MYSIRPEDLINKVAQYNQEEIMNVLKAYKFAEIHHQGQ